MLLKILKIQWCVTNKWWLMMCYVYTRPNFRIFDMWSNSYRNNILIIQDVSHLSFLKSLLSNNKIFDMINIYSLP